MICPSISGLLVSSAMFLKSSEIRFETIICRDGVPDFSVIGVPFPVDEAEFFFRASAFSAKKSWLIRHGVFHVCSTGWPPCSSSSGG